MKTYIGTKIIRAEPQMHYGPTGEEEPGYKVLYPDSYESWSPKDVFEAAYRLISPAEVRLFSETGDEVEDGDS